MWNKAKDAELMEQKRKVFLEKGFSLFAEKSIEPVTLSEVAEASGYGMATLYRYFDKKPGFVVAVAAWKWEQFRAENKKRRPRADVSDQTAFASFDFYLESFLELYRNHRDLLRFNQFFNIYLQAEKIGDDVLAPYQAEIGSLKAYFHEIYLKAQQDHTLRTDIPEQEIFCTTLHLMLAAVTRYAVGLVYTPEDGFDAEKELRTMKDMLIARYKGTL